MKPQIARHCPECKSFHQIDIHSNQELNCPECDAFWGKIDQIDQIFEYCPVCQCRQFYLSKNFNQFIGCGIMLIGIILVPWTFGLSLPVFALIDWLMVKRIKNLANCYRCGTEYHHLSYPKHLKPFMHHIGLKYDKYR